MITAFVRNAVLRRDGWRCRHCKFRQNLHLHHVQFLSHNGPDESTNLLTLCNSCHEGVHAGKLIIWIGETSVNGSAYVNVEADIVRFEKIQKWNPS